MAVLYATVPQKLAAKGGTDKIEIKTDAKCGMCKQRIETAVSQLQGVKSAVLNLDTKVLTVKYKASKVSADDIRTAVTKTGYDADSMTADPDARKSLPGCCTKKGE